MPERQKKVENKSAMRWLAMLFLTHDWRSLCGLSNKAKSNRNKKSGPENPKTLQQWIQIEKKTSLKSGQG
jgi:hypothetical protein